MLNPVCQGVKINTLEVENLKRIKAVQLDCTGNALTVIGGENGQGKTSVLDAIAYALGGERYCPGNAKRDESVIPPEIKVTLSNGIKVERRGKNSALKVTDPNGVVSGQQLLNEFIPQFALDIPKFTNWSDKEKAEILLQVIGIGEELAEIETEEKRIYNERQTFHHIADQKKKFAAEMPYHPDCPEVPITATDLIKKQQAILATNGENQKKRKRVKEIETDLADINKKIQSLSNELIRLKTERDAYRSDFEISLKTAAELEDICTANIEENISNIDEINIKVRANLDKAKAVDDAESHLSKYHELTVDLESVRKSKMDLLNSADLPLPGLSVVDSKLTYNGQPWDCMSGSDQLQVATAIVRKLNPKCGFVLLDKLEQMDVKSLLEFGEWLESEGLQAIATRVSTGDECSIIIEDGTGVLAQEKPTYQKGEF